MLRAAIVLVSLALVFYTAGVWAERRSATLKAWHLALFGIGLACDTVGTVLMTQLPSDSASAAGQVLTTIMMVTGGVALALMAAHLAWGIVVLRRGRPDELATFHRRSLVIWLLWLIPYVTGAVGAAL